MFKVVGVSKLNGAYKVRFANDITRIKVLAKNGHEDIEFMELPEAVEKGAAVKALMASEYYQRDAFKEAIDAADAKYNGEKVVKVKAPKAEKPAKEAKPKAEKAPAAPKVPSVKAAAKKAKAPKADAEVLTVTEVTDADASTASESEAS